MITASRAKSYGSWILFSVSETSIWLVIHREAIEIMRYLKNFRIFSLCKSRVVSKVDC